VRLYEETFTFLNMQKFYLEVYVSTWHTHAGAKTKGRKTLLESSGIERGYAVYFLWGVSDLFLLRGKFIDSCFIGLEQHSPNDLPNQVGENTFYSPKYKCLDGDATPFKLVELRPQNRMHLPNVETVV